MPIQAQLPLDARPRRVFIQPVGPQERKARQIWVFERDDWALGRRKRAPDSGGPRVFAEEQHVVAADSLVQPRIAFICDFGNSQSIFFT
jgi:hypothetical protein